MTLEAKTKGLQPSPDLSVGFSTGKTYVTLASQAGEALCIDESIQVLLPIQHLCNLTYSIVTVSQEQRISVLLVKGEAFSVAPQKQGCVCLSNPLSIDENPGDLIPNMICKTRLQTSATTILEFEALSRSVLHWQLGRFSKKSLSLLVQEP